MNDISKQGIGLAPDGKEAHRYTLRNKEGMHLELLSWGATLSRLQTPDCQGRVGDVVLGFSDPRNYFDPHPYFGSTIGRYANRIHRGQCFLGDKQLELSRNEGLNHLHGGYQGFDKVSWHGESFTNSSFPGVRFHHSSPDGTEGYPGNLDVIVEYLLVDRDVRITYQAVSSQPTIVNLTNHSYFNLFDGGLSSIWSHELFIHADYVTETNKQGIPTGHLKAIKDTGLDFRFLRTIGEARSQLAPSQVEFSARRQGDSTSGYGDERVTKLTNPMLQTDLPLAPQRNYFDDNFVLKEPFGELRLAAKVFESRSGRKLELWTTQAGLQFYSGQFITGDNIGFEGGPYKPSSGFCLEAQNFPDAPNHNHFPPSTLMPGDSYSQSIIFRFPD